MQGMLHRAPSHPSEQARSLSGTSDDRPAVCVWEGFVDCYRNAARHGGFYSQIVVSKGGLSRLGTSAAPLIGGALLAHQMSLKFALGTAAEPMVLASLLAPALAMPERRKRFRGKERAL
jgi:hypothetical protein